MLQLRYLQRYTLLPSQLSLSRVKVHPASRNSCCIKFPHANHCSVRSYVQTPPTTTPTNPSQLSIFQRAHQYIRDNPYTKFSLTLCAIVLGLSVAIELVKKYKKKKPPSIVGSLPAVGHYTIQRLSEVTNLSSKLKSLDNDRGVPLLFVTGPSGVGKTELVSQYLKVYTASCTKWFGLKSVQPIVLFINGRNRSTFDLSLKDTAVSLGLKETDIEREEQSTILSLVHSRLVERKLPWMIVVDGLDESLVSDLASVVFNLPHSSMSSDWSSPTGGVVITTTSTPQVPQENILPVKERLSSEDGVDLLAKLSKLDIDSKIGSQLVEELHCHPMSIALAANTIRIYQPYLERKADSSSPEARYMDVLKHSIAEGACLTDAVFSLYIEAAIVDPRFQHTFDLLGSCDLRYPIPLSLIGQHLTSSFYSIAKEDLAPPTSDQMARYREVTGLNQEDDESLLGLVKALLPFLRKKPPSSEQLAEVLESADDTAHFVRECPLLAFKKFNSGFEYVEVHKLAQRWLPALFLKHTAPSMDKGHLVEEEARFERGAWFRQLRKFDPVKSLEKFHQSLPGISAPGVMTSDQFKKHHPIVLNPSQSDSRSQFSTNDELSYSDYQHLISHHHRVLSTLNSELKAAGGDYRDIHLKQYLKPHFASLVRHPVLSSPDSLLCEQALLSTEATTVNIKQENYQEFVSRYEDIIAKQKRLFGSGSQVVAHTMTDLADFKYSFRDITGARELLLTSLSILEKVQSRYADDEYKFDVGLTYTALAYVYDDLGDKRKCKDLLERALAAYQTMPKDGKVSKRQRKLVASSLTNIAHAYLSLGDLVMAKKYIDLASVAHQNLYVDAHPESVRAMNISSNIYALLGDKSESIRLRTEAGKVKAKLDSKPLLV